MPESGSARGTREHPQLQPGSRGQGAANARKWLSSRNARTSPTSTRLAGSRRGECQKVAQLEERENIPNFNRDQDRGRRLRSDVAPASSSNYPNECPIEKCQPLGSSLYVV